MSGKRIPMSRKFVSFCILLGGVIVPFIFGLPQADNRISKALIERLIHKHGKRPFIHRLLALRHKHITVYADGRFKDFVGMPSSEFVTADTILIDLEKIDVKTTHDLKRFVATAVSDLLGGSYTSLKPLSKHSARPKSRIVSSRSREVEVFKDLGSQPYTFGSSGQAKALLNLIDDNPGKSQYKIFCRTNIDVVIFGCDLEKDILLRLHQKAGGKHGTAESWHGHVLYRLQSAAKGGSLNDTPRGKQPGTSRSMSANAQVLHSIKKTPGFYAFMDYFSTLCTSVSSKTGINFFTYVEDKGDGIIHITAADIWLSRSYTDRLSTLGTIYGMWQMINRDLPVAVWIVGKYGQTRMCMDGTGVCISR